MFKVGDRIVNVDFAKSEFAKSSEYYTGTVIRVTDEYIAYVTDDFYTESLYKTDGHASTYEDNIVNDNLVLLEIWNSPLYRALREQE
jgi:hypothetical protein